jgi:hypothetical protein
MFGKIYETITNLIERLSVSKTSQFIGITYTSKSGRVKPETSRMVINTNVDLNRVYREDIETLKNHRETLTDDLEITVCDELINSLETSLEKGIGNNPNYTRKGTTESINGTLRKVFTKDGEFYGVEILGLIRSKVVLVEGEYKKVNSRPKTILKNKMKKQLNLGTSKIRCLRVNLDNIGGVRHNGDVVELIPTPTLVGKVNGKTTLTTTQTHTVTV